MQQDIAQAHAELGNTPCDYGFPLRPYQEQAIRAVEAAIGEGQRAILLAMATGKTKTCIALIYRLLKTKRFRRILFLVDRSALGEPYGLVFDPHPPYTILATDRIDFATMQRLVRFARYWDMVANSGRFANTLPLILGDAPFANFIALSDWLYAKTDATHRIALDRLAALVVEWLGSHGLAAEAAAEVLATDYAGQAHKLHIKQKAVATAKAAKSDAVPQRQARHLAA